MPPFTMPILAKIYQIYLGVTDLFQGARAVKISDH